MSGAQTSASMPLNQLYDMVTGQTGISLQHGRNELMQQQQDISGHQIEMGARLASTLLDETLYPTPEARAAAYPDMIARARAQYPGYFDNAPATYPGDGPTRALARMGTPSADLIKLQGTAGAVDAYGNSIGVGGGGGTRPAGGGGGGGTGTVGGADTAPINAAGDSRTRKAAEGGPPAAGSPGAAVAKQVHDFWISKGFSEEQTAGIMAGGPGSESDFTPTAGGDKVNGVATSIGLYQHHGPRLHNAQGTGLLDRYGPNPTADQQNQYALWEITEGPLKHVGEMLKNAKTAAEAAAIWTQYFGVPADRSEIGRRAAGAGRFVGLYGQPQGPPGGSTAPAVATGDVARPGDVPPPPGGAQGAYPAYGGGMGAVIGGQPAAARATIPAGRPTGPPVITDQPAGGGVVAGPPGVATVGAPQPPGPAVAGNVAAINAGIAGAGGQPVTDPNLTPTPARYAGNAPAPSVEAAPEAGWGTGVGSGYGPQNALAPAPPAPAQPAVPAAQQPPAPAQQPPAPTPAAQVMPPELQTDNSYLTDRDKQQLKPLFDQARRGLIPLTTLQNEVQQRQTFNVQRQKDFLAAQHQQMAEQRQQEAAAALAEQRRIENARAAETQRLAQEAAQRARAKEDREAVEANKPFHGNTPDAQNRNILIEGTNTGKTATTEYSSAYADYGTQKVDANGLKYRPDMSPYATPTGKTYGEGRGGRELGKADIGQGPLPPPVIHTAIQGNLAGLRNVDRALKELDAHPDSVGMTGLQPEWLSQRTDPEGIKLRADISDILSQVFHERSGAAVMVQEAARMKPFVPSQVDTATALRTKLERIRQNYLDTLYDHYSTYGPENGGRAMSRVEAALKDYSPTAEPANKPLTNTKIKVDANGNIIR